MMSVNSERINELFLLCRCRSELGRCIIKGGKNEIKELAIFIWPLSRPLLPLYWLVRGVLSTRTFDMPAMYFWIAGKKYEDMPHAVNLNVQQTHRIFCCCYSLVSKLSLSWKFIHFCILNYHRNITRQLYFRWNNYVPHDYNKSNGDMYWCKNLSDERH